jgi:hypothetical protein
MTKAERKTAIDIIVEGTNKLEERTKANWKRGLITSDEEQESIEELYKAMKELIKLMIIEVA